MLWNGGVKEVCGGGKGNGGRARGAREANKHGESQGERERGWMDERMGEGQGGKGKGAREANKEGRQ